MSLSDGLEDPLETEYAAAVALWQSLGDEGRMEVLRVLLRLSALRTEDDAE
jgi:hypothetical protein